MTLGFLNDRSLADFEIDNSAYSAPSVWHYHLSVKKLTGEIN